MLSDRSFGVKRWLLMQMGRKDESRVAFNQAIALANTAAEATQIRRYLDRLANDGAEDVKSRIGA